MSSTEQLHDLGQSLWLDNITRDILDDGTLKRYIDTQEEHHRTCTFQQEYRKFLERYGVEYDERYVWS